MLMLGGYGGRLGCPILKYTNNPVHTWFTVVDVLYGASMWQVGNSVEQNGAYKIVLSRIKKDIIAKNTKLVFKQLTINIQEIIILVNLAWSQLFAEASLKKVHR